MPGKPPRIAIRALEDPVVASAREKWEKISQTPEIVQFFLGLFDSVGVRILDNSGEEFTCLHMGDHISFRQGIDPDNVDYIVDIKSHQVDRLVEHSKSGKLDEIEQYRVISTIFTPATAATLKIPIFSHWILRRIAGAEDVIHVHLTSPSAEEKDVAHTLIFARKQWIVVPGLHGNPGRTYKLSMGEAHTYQRHAFLAIKRKSIKELLAFSRWYRQWRSGVSTQN